MSYTGTQVALPRCMKKKTQTKKAKTETAITLLESQHREVEALFDAFESASDDDDTEQGFALAGQVCERLTVHATIEEEIFYPAAQSEETEEGLAEAAVEHMSAKRLIADIQALKGRDDKKLKALMSVLQEQIEHHVEEEEEQLFPQATEVLSAEELVELGERLQARADELKMEGPGATQGASFMAAEEDAAEDEDDEDEDEDEDEDDDAADEEDIDVDDDVSKDQLSAKKRDIPIIAPKKAAKTTRAAG